MVVSSNQQENFFPHHKNSCLPWKQILCECHLMTVPSSSTWTGSGVDYTISHSRPQISRNWFVLYRLLKYNQLSYYQLQIIQSGFHKVESFKIRSYLFPQRLLITPRRKSKLLLYPYVINSLSAALLSQCTPTCTVRGLGASGIPGAHHTPFHPWHLLQWPSVDLHTFSPPSSPPPPPFSLPSNTYSAIFLRGIVYQPLYN